MLAGEEQTFGTTMPSSTRRRSVPRGIPTRLTSSMVIAPHRAADEVFGIDHQAPSDAAESGDRGRIHLCRHKNPS